MFGFTKHQELTGQLAATAWESAEGRLPKGGTAVEYEAIRDKVRTILAPGTWSASTQAEAALRDYLDGSPDDRSRSLALGLLGQVLTYQLRVPEAQECFGQARPLAKNMRDRVVLLTGMAEPIVNAKLYEEARSVAQELGEIMTNGEAVLCDLAPWGYATCARMWSLLGRHDEALRAASKSVAAAHSAKQGCAEAYWCLAESLEACGDLPGAISNYETVCVYATSKRGTMYARARIGRLAVKTGDLPAARRSLGKAVDFTDLRDRQVLSTVLEAIADLTDADPASGVSIQRSLVSHLRVSKDQSSCEEVSLCAR